jgi:hypothetical protein
VLGFQQSSNALARVIGPPLAGLAFDHIGSDVEVEWIAAAASDGESGIVAVHVMTPSGVVRLD